MNIIKLLGVVVRFSKNKTYSSYTLFAKPNSACSTSMESVTHVQGSTAPHAGLTLPIDVQENNVERRGQRLAVLRMLGAIICIVGSIAACENC